MQNCRELQAPCAGRVMTIIRCYQETSSQKSKELFSQAMGRVSCEIKEAR